MPTLADDMVFAGLAIVLPLYSARVALPNLLRELRAGRPRVRLGIYRALAGQGWVFALVLLLVWVAQGRALSAFGLHFGGGWRLPAGLGMAVAGGLALHGFHVWLLSFPKGRDWLLRQVKPFADFLPHTIEEKRRFYFVSLTAGVWEELLFRGFLVWYLTALLNIETAVVLSSLLFGLVHLYQGWTGVLRVAGVGLLLCALFLWTGSLWAPMLLHVLVDLAGGSVSYRLLGAADQPAAE